MVNETFMYQKLERCKFGSANVDIDELELMRQVEASDEESEPEETPVDSETGRRVKKPLKPLKLFRDVVSSTGGKLNHNLIKLKYEKRHQLAETPN